MTPPFDLSRYQDPLTIQRVLHNAKTIAIVGLSKNELRASYFVGFYLQAARLPRHPGQPARDGDPRREELQEPAPTCRCPSTSSTCSARRTRCPAIASEAVAIGARNLWCQFTVINEEGARIAEAGGLSVVMDRCIKVEHARYVGRMHWLGFNTQRITSVRGGLQ